jgi:tetratricopeptide (TPR) repeat protein
MALRTLLLVLLMLLPSCAGARVLAKNYMTLVKKTSKSSIKSVMRQADRYLEAGHQDTAQVYYMVVCNRMDDKLSDEDKYHCAMAFLKKGNIYYMKGGFADALKAYFSGLRIIKTCEDQKGIGRFYNNIANVYCAFNELEKAYTYYETEYKCCSKYRDHQNEYKILTNLTILNVKLGKTREARKCFNLSEKLKDKNSKADNFMGRFNYGLILIAEKNFAQAVSNFKSLLSYSFDVGMDEIYLFSLQKAI